MADRHDIITLPNPTLRRQSERIHVVTDEVRQLITDMKAATLDWEESRPHELSVALAAIQIARPFRVVIVRNDFDNKDDQTFTVLINPEIIKFEGDIVYDHEGCLSVRDIYGLVGRYSRVRVKALDENGNEIRVKADGFLARILQHEIDHTNGTLFIDHITDPNSYFLLTDEGELKGISYDDIVATGILR